jgi:predicted nucleic acid-binding protein
MSVRIVVLDAGPLGLAASPARTQAALSCQRWVAALEAAGAQIVVPEIADYEVRRELLLAGKTASVARLDLLKARSTYLPISTAVVLHAADLWAQARRAGVPTADRHALDCDVILAAQALSIGAPAGGIAVATGNAVHVSRYVTSARWEDIRP